MQRRMYAMGPAVFATALLLSGTANAAPDVTGVWINDTGRGAVEIKSCGDALCGHVVWTKDKADAKGCGKQIIGDATKVGAGLWDNGWIYSPEKKARYDVELKPLDNGNLRVTGYAGTKFFSKTMIWTRAPADLARCDKVQAAVTPTPALAPAAKPAETPAASSAPETKPAPTPPAAASGSKPTTEAAVIPPKPVPEPQANADRPIADQSAKVEPAKAAGTSPPEPAQPNIAATSEPKPASPPDDAAATPPPAAPEAKVANRENDDEDDKPAKTPKRKLKLGDLKLDELKLDKVLKRTASGDCKLDLPWVKVRFHCEDK